MKNEEKATENEEKAMEDEEMREYRPNSRYELKGIELYERNDSILM